MVTSNEQTVKTNGPEYLDWEIEKADAFSRALKKKVQSSPVTNEKSELVRLSKKADEVCVSMKLSYLKFDDVSGGDSNTH